MLTVRQKIFGMIAVALSGIVIATGFAEIELDQAFDNARYSYVNTLPSIQVLDSVKILFTTYQLEVNRAILLPGLEQDRNQVERLAALRKRMLAALDSYAGAGCNGGSCISDDMDRVLYEDVRRQFLDILPQYDQLIDAARQGAGDTARTGLVRVAAVADFLDALIDKDYDYNQTLAVNTASHALRLRAQANLLLGLFLLITMMVVGGIGAMIARRLTGSLGGEPSLAARIVERIADGDLDVQVPVAKGDKSSLLARMHIMVDSLRKLADRATAIGGGDLEGELELLSPRDTVGRAINAMTENLRKARDAEISRRWLQEGDSELTAALSGDLSPGEVAEIAAATTARRLSAGRGVIYCPNQEGALILEGSFMFSARPGLTDRFGLGEGTVGQVAREKKPIHLASVPDDAAPILTGTTHNPPLFVYAVPLLQDDTLVGVLELASFVPFDRIHLDYLESATRYLGTQLFLAAQRERVKGLLAQTERSEQEMRRQRDALQTANLQMEEQQQQLQQQSEELLQSNAQMEEQQQQLQQQSEELRMSNEQLEQQRQMLEARNEELRRSESELNRRTDLLETSNRYKSQFLANMSHELRTPLNAVILLSQLMIRDGAEKIGATGLRYAEVIHRSGEELLRLINDVLDLSKVEAGQADIRPTSRASREIAAHLRDLFEPAAKQQGLDFTIEDALEAEIESDQDKLEQILRNLLSNAMKFTRQGGVTLSFRRDESDPLPIRIAVADTGIGIAHESHSLIFEAFRQVDGSASREFSGTGLGLTISARLAELLGGTLSVESELGRGSVFLLALPDHPAAAPLATIQAPPLEAPPSDDRDLLGSEDRALLLVDDDVAFCTALLSIMRRSGQKTLVATTAAEGLVLARRFRPAGILLDLGLPDRDGGALLQDIKSDPDLSAIPVFIVSARDRDDALVEAGAAGYLQKPADDRQLTAVAETILGLSAQAGGILILGDGSLDASRLQGLLGNQPKAPSAEITQAAAGEAGIRALQEGDWRLVILDISEHSLAETTSLAEQVRRHQPQAAILFYSSRPIGEAEEAALRRYSDTVIVKAPQSERRLLREIGRLLRKPPERTGLGASARNAAKRLEGREILVVDDDPRNLFVLTAAFEQNGARVTTATSAKATLQMLTRQKFDLLITDLMMPEMDGYELAAACRADPATATLPIIALTAKAMPKDREQAFAAGCSDYLTKPVDYDMLVNMADLWCRRER